MKGGSGDALAIIRDIGNSPDLYAEAKRVSADFANLVEPAGDETVIRLLFPLVTVYGSKERTDAEWDVFWGPYLDVLSPLPEVALIHGIKEHARHSSFFPKPADVYEPASKLFFETKRAAFLLRRALELPAPGPKKGMTPEDKAELIAKGYLNPDGSVNLPKPKGIPTPERGPSKHEVAEALRAQAEAEIPEAF